MRSAASKPVFATLAVLLPSIACAQEIPPLIAALAISPVLVFLLAIILGVLKRSWRVGLGHAGLVAVWIFQFGVASYWAENDFVIWTPLALYGIHAVTMVVLIARSALERVKS